MSNPGFPADAILRFAPDSDYYIFSNFPLSPVILDGVTYPSVEHGYQASKIYDLETRLLKITNDGVLGMTSAEVKKWGRKLPLPENWVTHRAAAMWPLLKQKWEVPITETSLSRKLLLTGDRLLVEGNYWHDTFWGKCYCPKHNWSGENYLGRMLMRIRRRLSTEPEWLQRLIQSYLTFNQPDLMNGLT